MSDGLSVWQIAEIRFVVCKSIYYLTASQVVSLSEILFVCQLVCLFISSSAIAVSVYHSIRCGQSVGKFSCLVDLLDPLSCQAVMSPVCMAQSEDQRAQLPVTITRQCYVSCLRACISPAFDADVGYPNRLHLDRELQNEDRRPSIDSPGEQKRSC